MKLAAIMFAALLPLSASASNDTYCVRLASVYTLAHTLRDLGLSDQQTANQLEIYSDVPEGQRMLAIQRVSLSGDLGFMKAKTIWKHVYLECKAGN